MDLDSVDYSEREPVHAEPNRLLPAILASVLFHGALALLLVNSTVGDSSPPRPSSVSVSLLERNPLRVDPENTVTPEASPLEERAVVTTVDEEESEPTETELLGEPEATPEPVEPLGNLADVPVLDSIEPEVPETEQGVQQQLKTDVSILPSVLAVQNSLREVDAQSRSWFYAYDCDPLEEEAGIRQCKPDSGNNNYQLIERNSTYRALNPIRQRSRSQQVSGIVAGQSRDLAGRLQEGAIPEGLSDYVLEELEAGITHDAELGNRAVKHMIDSTDKSAAAAIARELLDDEWIIQKSKELRNRKVHIRD